MAPAKRVVPVLGQRYRLVFWASLGLFVVYAMRINLSVAVVLMQAQFGWTAAEKGWVLSSFFIGYIVGQVPGGYLATRYGGKTVFGVGVLTTAILTILLPWSVCWDWQCTGDDSHLWSLNALRIVMGIFESVTYPAVYALLSKWAPENERSRMTCITTAGAFLGTALALPASSWLGRTFGWPAIFYAFGSLGGLWCLGWFALTASSPRQHRCISEVELNYIESTIATARCDVPPPSVWLAFFTNRHSLSLFVNHCAANWGLYLLLTELPSYLSDVFDYDLRQAAFLEVLPYLLLWGLVVLSGVLSDYLSRRYSRTFARKLLQTMGCVFPSACFISLGCVHAGHTSTAVALVTLAIGSGGFLWGGYAPNALDLSPRWGGLLFSVSNTLATIPGILAPVVSGALVRSQPGTLQEYQSIFYLTAGIYLLAAAVWLCGCSGEAVPALNAVVDQSRPSVLRSVAEDRQDDATPFLRHGV